MLQKLKSLLFKLIISSVLAVTILFSGNIKDSYYRDNVGQNVVRIFNMEKTGSGSGFHIKDKHGNMFILTNKHVCEIADKKGMVLVEVNGEEIPRKVVEKYEHHDLCLVEPVPNHETYIDIASSSELGEDLTIVGHPGGRDLTLSHGELIGKKIIHLGDPVESEDQCKDGEIRFNPFMGYICLKAVIATSISAISYGGNSGSPVVNKYGNVIGVLFAGSSQPTDSYMVPLKYIQDFLGE